MRDFHYTVNVLVKAYLNDTLKHGACTACAVGNIIADSMGLSVRKDFYKWEGDGYSEHPEWHAVFATQDFGKTNPVDLEYYRDCAKDQIDMSGYSPYELARIESAFESHNPFNYDTELMDENDIEQMSMFNGLMAVVDVLADIHNIDLSTKEEAKKAFVKTSS
jgi:hypothetical protein